MYRTRLWLASLLLAVSASIAQGASGGILGNYTINNTVGGSFNVGQSWTLSLTGVPGYSALSLCGFSGTNPVICVPYFAYADYDGSWKASGTFNNSTIGSWTEWIQLSSGETSTRISFTVGGGTLGNFAINNFLGGNFAFGQMWALSLTGAQPLASFALCAAEGMGPVSCTKGFGTTDASGAWKYSGTFTNASAGGWTEWLQFPSGAVSNRISFTLGAIAPDTIPPSTPGNLRASPANPTTVIISWDPSTDNSGTPPDYHLYQNGSRLASLYETSWTVTVTPDTPYSFAVDAYDESGNVSPLAGPITVNTNICKLVPGGAGAPTIQFTYVPPLGGKSSNTLLGQVLHVVPTQNYVAVFIRVDTGWWTKPWWDEPETAINCDGTWASPIDTGGIDEEANQIRAYVLPATYTVPLLSGEQYLPSDIDTHAIAQITVNR